MAAQLTRMKLPTHAAEPGEREELALQAQKVLGYNRDNMTGQELLEKLQSLPAATLALKVYKYCGTYEEGEMLGPADITVVSEDAAPYEKGDSPWVIEAIDPKEKLLYI